MDVWMSLVTVEMVAVYRVDLAGILNAQ